MSIFDEIINRKGTYCTQWDYVRDRFGIDDVLPFSISDMDFKAPVEVIEDLKNRVEHGIFGYSRWNHDDYKNSVLNWYKSRFNYDLNKDWIIYVPSVIYAINKIFEVVGEKDDKVLFLTPAYDNFFKSLSSSKRDFITSHLVIENNNFVINWQDFENKLKEVKFFLFCNPHNPTGRVWTETELEQIIILCKKYNVIIVSDDIHMDIVYKPAKFIPILEVAEKQDYTDNTIIVTSGSKSFNTPSLGGAYCLIPNFEIYKKLMSKVKEQDSLGSPMILGILALMSSYNKCAYWIDDLLDYLYNNLLITQKFLKENYKDIDLIMPQGTYLAWINLSKLNLSMNEIQERLVNIGQVGIMRGDIYGEEKNYLRLNVACSTVKLQDGLIRFKKSFTDIN